MGAHQTGQWQTLQVRGASWGCSPLYRDVGARCVGPRGHLDGAGLPRCALERRIRSICLVRTPVAACGTVGSNCRSVTTTQCRNASPPRHLNDLEEFGRPHCRILVCSLLGYLIRVPKGILLPIKGSSIALSGLWLGAPCPGVRAFLCYDACAEVQAGVSPRVGF